jgi:hypothetical protein
MDLAKLAEKNVYLDPFLINLDDHTAFNGATCKERDKIRKAAHETTRSKVISTIHHECNASLPLSLSLSLYIYIYIYMLSSWL